MRENLQEIQARIERACQSVGRDPGEVTLIAVSKTQPIEAISALYEAGHRHFGESRLQEALPKIDALPDDIVWHFIGTLQSNKAKRIGQVFGPVHTLASESQLKELGKASRRVETCLEVNVAREPQKAGLLPEKLDGLLRSVLECPQVLYQGLMTIGPLAADPEASRPYFRKLRELRDQVGGSWLSMGMSQDFEVAIQEGATHVRVGTALFGKRRIG